MKLAGMFNGFPTYEQFCSVMPSHRQFYFDCQHAYLMVLGKLAGWWELSWDVFEHDCDLYPICLVVVSIADTEHKQFSSLLCSLKLFKSAADAKRNGWNKPLTIGDYFFKKKTYILRVVE